MARAIDYDRGVLIKKDEKSGIEVFMYLDEPGVFLSQVGRELAPELAAAAGYPVVELLKKREIKIRMAKAEIKIRAELEAAEEGSKIIQEKDGFKVLDIGLGRHRVLGPDNEPLTSEVLTKEQATLLVEQLAPDPVS